MLWFYWLDGLEGPLNPPNGEKKQFHGFDSFWVPTEGWKATAPWTRTFRFCVNFNIYSKSCIHLKADNVNIEYECAKDKNFCIFEIFLISKWKNGQKLIEFPLRKIPPWNQKFFDLHQNPKIQLHLSLAGGAHYAGYDSYCKKLQVAGLQIE